MVVEVYTRRIELVYDILKWGTSKFSFIGILWGICDIYYKIYAIKYFLGCSEYFRLLGIS